MGKPECWNTGSRATATVLLFPGEREWGWFIPSTYYYDFRLHCILRMLKNGTFSPVYEGEMHTAKVRGLREQTVHRFRIRAAVGGRTGNLLINSWEYKLEYFCNRPSWSMVWPKRIHHSCTTASISSSCPECDRTRKWTIPNWMGPYSYHLASSSVATAAAGKRWWRPSWLVGRTAKTILLSLTSTAFES